MKRFVNIFFDIKMARRGRINNNLHLFQQKSDTLTTRSIRALWNKSYFPQNKIKGFENDNMPNKTTGDNLLTIKGASSNSTLDLEKIKNALNVLSNYCNTPVKDLKGSIKDDLDGLIQISQVLHNSALYDRFIQEVKTAFSGCKDPAPGTVGAFFMGCFMVNGFKGGENCDARCAGSLPPSNNDGDWFFCKKLVILYDPKDNTFNSLNDSSPTETYLVIVGGDKFEGFSDREILELNNYGVKKAQLLRYNNGAYDEITTDFVDTNNLPKNTTTNNAPNTNNPHNTNNTNNSQNTNNSNGGSMTGIIILLLIILLVIVILALAWRASRQQSIRVMNYD